MKGIKRINNYLFISELKKGTICNVYLAIDEKSNKLIAVKQIALDKIINKNGLQNLKNELKLLNSINNENIIKILGIEKTKNNIYIILEYCNGKNLLEYKKYYEYHYKKQINEFYIQKIIKQLINGLEYMNNKKIIHRDIKLENLLINFLKFPNSIKNKNEIIKPIELEQTSLNDDFQIKISDLGYSKDLSDNLTKSTFCGSPMIMTNVENQFNEKNYNSKVDLWSLGVITYELLIGKPPFYDNNINDLINKIREDKYILPKNMKISLEIISFINGLLQFNPDKRMNWEQIKEHPFITKNIEEFNYFNFETINKDNKKNIEINVNDLDNYLWLEFKKNNDLNINLDKINFEVINKFKEMEKKIDKSEKKNESDNKSIKLKNENINNKENINVIKEEQKKITNNELKNNILSELKIELQNLNFDLDEINIKLTQIKNQYEKNLIEKQKLEIENNIKKIKNQIKKEENLKKNENEYVSFDYDDEWEELKEDEIPSNKIKLSKEDFEIIE